MSGATRLALLAALSQAGPARAWGPAAHQAATAKAIDTLPGGLKGYYKAHRLELPTLALEPSFPDEGGERRFAVDRLLAFPFSQLPHDEKSFVARFPEAGVGRLPWLIHESYARLVRAFKERDKAAILGESDLLASLVTDLHNPLALTDNADGQKTGQHGLWVRFGNKLPEAMAKRLELSPDAAVLVDQPERYVFSMLSGAYVWIDNLLYEEELARRGRAGYGEIYYEALARRAGPLLRARLSQAAQDAGSYWYTAWTAAGRPELK
jgi:hypothetical protein